MTSSTRPAPSARSRRTRRSAVLLTCAAATAMLLAGCGGPPSAGAHHGEAGAEHAGPSASTTTSSPASPTASPTGASPAQGASAHGDADAAFARDMVVHHEGALEMAQLAVQRASTPEVRALAERVVAAQQPEIDLMQGWLAAWGEDGTDGQHDGQHGGTDMSAMGMSEQDATALRTATGTAFDRLFLEQMTAHHRGAVQMAQQELASGTDPEARALAQRIEADQTAEISEMAALLAALPA
ncbi:DUF305 domain-containing protein [Streptomyces sp. NP160]|uniref:DUF305 domain-containing protein n=1 Tax=Streptomyces sp. NP160 TaxID=2586637 RepID=UPI00111B3416|nr:DUF305 domain-containing protein [Streptomyces sp. NP160]TNM59978.1 DUF305 domain-containing protein [Streptomyces sp. NP160]